MNEFRLSIDYGTTNTVAVLAPPGEPARPLLFDGLSQLPSAVYAESDGTLLTGTDARHSARLNPACYEPNPKRRIEDGSVLLGTTGYPVVELIAATLRRVLAEARPRAGMVPPQVVLTYPASWGMDRMAVLRAAASLAGIQDPQLVAEPLAAAAYLVAAGHHVPDHGNLVVYDLGAGTFDVSVVRRTGDTFTTLAFNGLVDVGGLDLDERVFALIGAAIEPDYPDEWADLREPQTMADRRQAQLLWDDARAAKERLSRQPSTQVPIPSLGIDVPITRAAFEEVAEPLLSRTTFVTADLLRASRIRPQDPAELFLVGGATRTPLVSALLRQTTRREPTAVEAPEQVVALGALRIPAPDRSSPSHQAPPAAPPPAAPTSSRPRWQPTVKDQPSSVEDQPSPLASPGGAWPSGTVHDGRTAQQPKPGSTGEPILPTTQAHDGWTVTDRRAGAGTPPWDGVAPPWDAARDGRTTQQPPLPDDTAPWRGPEPSTIPLQPAVGPYERVKLVPNPQRHLFRTLAWGALLAGSGLVVGLSIGNALVRFVAGLAILAGLAGTGFKLYDWVRCMTGCHPMTIDATGITVERDGRGTTFPWSQIATVYLHPYQGDQWIACTPLSNERLGADEKTRAFFRNPPGLFLLSGTSGFGEEVVREALRRFAGPRYR